MLCEKFADTIHPMNHSSPKQSNSSKRFSRIFLLFPCKRCLEISPKLNASIFMHPHHLCPFLYIFSAMKNITSGEKPGLSDAILEWNWHPSWICAPITSDYLHFKPFTTTHSVNITITQRAGPSQWCLPPVRGQRCVQGCSHNRIHLYNHVFTNIHS